MSLDESDSYREFELYLEQVNDEIMRVFEDCKLPYSLQQHDAELVKNKYIDSEKTFQWDSTANYISKLSSETQSDDSHEEAITSNTTCSCNDLNSNAWFENGAPHSTCSTHFPSLPNVYVSKCVDPAGNIVQCGNDKHSKSMDDLPTSSWLYAENNFNDDHLPATSMLKKVNKQTCSQLDRRVAVSV